MFLLFLQAVLLAGNFVLGLLVSIPIGMSKSNYDGNCLLYSYVKKKKGQHLVSISSNDLQPGSNITCNFCIFTGCISLLLSVVLLIGTIFLLMKSNNIRFMVTIDKTSNSKAQLWKKRRNPLVGAWVHFCASSGMAIILFITACLISTGFHHFCEHAMERVSDELNRCSQLEKRMGSFYKDLSIAQISSWVGAAFWLTLAVIGRFQLKKMNPKNLEYSKSRTATSDYSQMESVSAL